MTLGSVIAKTNTNSAKQDSLKVISPIIYRLKLVF